MIFAVQFGSHEWLINRLAKNHRQSFENNNDADSHLPKIPDLGRIHHKMVVNEMSHFVELLVELIELRRLGHDVFVHEEWRLDLLVASFPQEVEGVCDQCLVQVDTVIRQEIASVTSDLRPCEHAHHPSLVQGFEMRNY